MDSQAEIHAHGGDGASPGGGGGGGGLIRLQPPNGRDSWEMMLNSDLVQHVQARGGAGGTGADIPHQSDGQAGGVGAFVGPFCPKGMHGPLCLQCPRGSAKSQPGAQDCEICTPGTYADQMGMSACAACPPGNVSQAPNASQCVQCNVAEQPQGAARCVACPTPPKFAQVRATVEHPHPALAPPPPPPKATAHATSNSAERA